MLVSFQAKLTAIVDPRVHPEAELQNKADDLARRESILADATAKLRGLLT